MSARPTAAPLRLVAPPLSLDTIACLERLLEEARSGQVIGLAFVALKPQRHFISHACGEVHKERVFTRGMLKELDDGLKAAAAG